MKKVDEIFKGFFDVLSYGSEMFGEIQEERCYLLGLVAADGNLQEVGNGYRFFLNMVDEGIVQRVRDVLGYGNVTKQKPNKKIGKKDVYYLTICNKVLGEELIKMGITHRKTHTIAPPPELTDQQKIWWMRGYFDGDGCIYLAKYEGYYDKYCQINVVSGSYPAVELFLNTFRMSLSENTYEKTGNVLYTLRANGDNALSILNILYEGSRIHLNRKYSLFQEADKSRENIKKKKRKKHN